MIVMNVLHVIPNERFSDSRFAFIINGELNVTQEIYDLLYDEDIKDSLLESITIVDMDEVMYKNNIDKIRIFAGQQVKVYDSGKYIGDGTIVDYPYLGSFYKAMVSMHFPVRGELLLCPPNSLECIT